MAQYTYGQLVNLYATANNVPATSAEALTMGALAMAESSGDPNAHNPSGASGLWQIMPSHASDKGWTYGTNFYDPATNARMAYFVLHHQGYSAWTTYTNGAYRKFLGGSVPNVSPNISNAGMLAIPGIPGPGQAPLIGGGTGGGIIGGVQTPSTGSLLGIPTHLFDVGLWRRIGIALVGFLLIVVGLIILMRRPLAAGAKILA